MIEPLSWVKLDVFADYCQFYLWDPDLEDVMAPEDYSEEDITNRVKIAPGVFVVQTVRNMTVPVEVGIYAGDPGFSSGEWQHIAEAPLQLSKGRVEVQECTGGSLALLVAPASRCVVRALFRGLDTLSDDGLSGEDFYKIQIYPSEETDLKIVKKWE